MFVHHALVDYVVRLVVATRTPAEHGLSDIAGWVSYGASPRATLGIVAGARALALMRGRDYVLPQDMLDVAPDVLRHRLVLSYDALADEVPVDHIISRVLATVPLPQVTRAAPARPGVAAAAPLHDRRDRSPVGPPGARPRRRPCRDGTMEAALRTAGADRARPARRAAAGQLPRAWCRARAASRGRPAPTSPATTCAGWTGRSPPAPPSRTSGRPSPTGSWRPGWCVDLSPSLDFGTASCEKRDLAIAALAAVTHLTRGGGNRIGAVVATGAHTDRIPARGGLAHARGLLRAGRRDPARGPRAPAATWPRRSSSCAARRAGAGWPW